jgi:HK97 family phage prohead protease
MATEILRSVTEHPELEVREGPDGKPRIAGYAAVYNSLSVDLGGFVEIIRPGAFDRSLAEDPDVLARIQHEGGLSIIGRTTSGTLKVWTDKKGLRYEALVPDTTAGRDILELVKRGDISKSSFAFSLRRDDGIEPQAWNFEAEPVLRELLNLNLHDVAPVDDPAYPATSAQLRRESAETIRLAREEFERAKAQRDTPPDPTPTQEQIAERLRAALAKQSLSPYA